MFGLFDKVPKLITKTKRRKEKMKKLHYLVAVFFATSILLTVTESKESLNVTLESKLLWFFDKMEHDAQFRHYIIAAHVDDFDRSINDLLRPMFDWLVLLDPWNWPQPLQFGVVFDQPSNLKCQEASENPDQNGGVWQ